MENKKFNFKKNRKPKHISLGKVRDIEKEHYIEPLSTGHSIPCSIHGGSPININNNLITKNTFNFNIDELVSVGCRLNNTKRNFLFISKILGKHLIINPDISKATGYLLAGLVYPENNFNTNELKKVITNNNGNFDFNQSIKPEEKVIVIGFSETATAIGMSVACAIENSYYVTTTRESLTNINSLFNFEEEHSHATNHNCYLWETDKIESADRIILVDDEITTGNTMLNLIKEINKKYPNKKYSILSILDFRNENHYNNYSDFCQKNDIEIMVQSIISANMNIEKEFSLNKDNGFDLNTKNDIININILQKKQYELLSGCKNSYLTCSGRFGVSFRDIRLIEEYAEKIAIEIKNKINPSGKLCVIGHGEDIYIPSRIAHYLNSDFKTTTRSPIYTMGPIVQRSKFIVDDIPYYFYNGSEIEKNYDNVLFISENVPNVKLTKNCININL